MRRNMRVVKWTPDEIATVIREYPAHGAVGVAKMLTGRTVHAVKQQAMAHGVACKHYVRRSVKCERKKPQRRAYRPAYVKPPLSDEFNAWLRA